MARKYLSLERLTEYDALIKDKINEGDESVKSYVDTEIAKMASSSHTHDDRYYTETEIDDKLSTINTSISNITSGSTVIKNAEHATSADSATQANTAVSATKATQDGNGKVISDTYETKDDANAKLEEVKEYADTKVSGLASTSSVESAISTHNTSSDAHSDIREILETVKEDVDAFFKDATLSEEAKDTLKEIQDYITGDASAAAEMTASIANKADKVHTHVISDVSGLQDALDTNNEAIEGLTETIENVKEDAANQAVIVLSEAQKGIDANTDRIEVLETLVSNKVDTEHTHSWDDLEDRPFYENISGDILLEEQTVNCSESTGNGYSVYINASLAVTEGNEYTVIWDGIPYKVIAETNSLGNMYWNGSSTNTGEPFFIGASGSRLYIATENQEEHTLEVYSNYNYELKQLDEKFIPDNIQRSTDNNLTTTDKTIVGAINELNNSGVGKSTTGTVYTINDEEVTAAEGAETFNDYAYNIAIGPHSHAEGNGTKAIGPQSHAEGGGTTASGPQSHAEGGGTTASGPQSHAEGAGTKAEGVHSHAEGVQTTASGSQSHAEGAGTKASGDHSHAEGGGTNAIGLQSHAEGGGTTASGDQTHAEGSGATASGNHSHAEGFGTKAIGLQSHAEGYLTKSSGEKSHAEGDSATASGYASHAEGLYTTAEGDFSHAEGYYTTVEGDYSHAEGRETTASGAAAHAEGAYTTASDYASHAEGDGTTASGESSHAEGLNTTASGYASHAEGNGATASGESSHAEGVGTIATAGCQHVQGRYNIEDTNGNYAHIVGNGNSITKSNAHTLDWSGNAWYQGSVYVGGTSQDEGSKLLTENEVDVKLQDKANATHTHAISDITDLETTLANAASAISANTNSISANSNAISSLQAIVNDIQEISSEEIQALFA